MYQSYIKKRCREMAPPRSNAASYDAALRGLETSKKQPPHSYDEHREANNVHYQRPFSRKNCASVSNASEQ